MAKKKRVLIFDEKRVKLFGKKLKSVREKEKYTQKQLAFEAGITLSQITRIERGLTNPTISTVFKIADTLQVEAADLLRFEDE